MGMSDWGYLIMNFDVLNIVEEPPGSEFVSREYVEADCAHNLYKAIECFLT